MLKNEIDDRIWDVVVSVAKIKKLPKNDGTLLELLGDYYLLYSDAPKDDKDRSKRIGRLIDAFFEKKRKQELFEEKQVQLNDYEIAPRDQKIDPLTASPSAVYSLKEALENKPLTKKLIEGYSFDELSREYRKETGKRSVRKAFLLKLVVAEIVSAGVEESEAIKLVEPFIKKKSPELPSKAIFSAGRLNSFLREFFMKKTDSPKFVKRLNQIKPELRKHFLWWLHSQKKNGKSRYYSYSVHDAIGNLILLKAVNFDDVYRLSTKTIKPY